MNAKAVKLARKTSTILNIPLKKIKKEWRQLNWREKTRYANMMRAVVSQVEIPQ